MATQWQGFQLHPCVNPCELWILDDSCNQVAASKPKPQADLDYKITKQLGQLEVTAKTRHLGLIVVDIRQLLEPVTSRMSGHASV